MKIKNKIENSECAIIINKNGFIKRVPIVNSELKVSELNKQNIKTLKFVRCNNHDLVIFICEGTASGCHAFCIPETSGEGISFRILLKIPEKLKLQDVIIYKEKK